MKKIKIIIFLILTLFISCSENKNDYKININLSYEGDIEFKKVRYAIFEGEKESEKPFEIKTLNLNNEDLKTGVVIELENKLKNGKYLIIAYGDVKTDTNPAYTDKDPIIKKVIEIKDNSDINLVLKEPNGPLVCLEDKCTSYKDCKCQANYCITGSAAKNKYISGVCTIIGCKDGSCPDGFECVENLLGIEGFLKNPKSFCAKEKGSSLKLNISYKGELEFEKLRYAIFKGEEESGMPHDMGTQEFNNEELKKGVSFTTKKKLLAGKYLVIVYGDVEIKGVPIYTKDDPIIKQVVEIEDKDIELNLEILDPSLACLSNNCENNSACSCDANFCITENIINKQNYETNLCTIANCEDNSCPNGLICVKNSDDSNIKSFCAKEKMDVNKVNISIKLYYNGDKEINTIKLSLFKKYSLIAKKEETINSEINIEFPYVINLKYDDIDSALYKFKIYADINPNDGIIPKKSDPKVESNFLILEKGKLIKLELKLED